MRAVAILIFECLYLRGRLRLTTARRHSACMSSRALWINTTSSYVCCFSHLCCFTETTSRPAVAERPRDASCLSIASIVQYVERNFLLLVTSVSDLPLLINKLCSVFFVVVVHVGCDKQRFTDAWRSVR